MRTMVLSKTGGLFTVLLLLLLPRTHAVAASPDLLKAKKEAEAVGYTFIASHDEIVGLAKKEGKLRVMTGLESATFKPLTNAFKEKYPFISDIRLEEINGIDAHQRILLEIKSRQARGWDVGYMPMEFARDYMPYLIKHDILGMAKNGVLRIHPGLIHPTQRNVVSVTSTISVVAYNKKTVAEDQVPVKWEDFLKPEFKGKKFVLDIRPLGLAALVPAWGLERTLDFARKLADQQPVWGRGGAKIIAAIAAGEYSLYVSSTTSQMSRAMSKDTGGNLSYKIVEPVPTRAVDHSSGILNTADNPHTALLWLEFLASPEGQDILDKYEPLEASVFTPGSITEQMTRSKKLSVVDWDHFTKLGEYIEKIFAAYGFPKAEK